MSMLWLLFTCFQENTPILSEAPIEAPPKSPAVQSPPEVVVPEAAVPEDFPTSVAPSSPLVARRLKAGEPVRLTQGEVSTDSLPPPGERVALLDVIDDNRIILGVVDDPEQRPAVSWLVTLDGSAETLTFGTYRAHLEGHDAVVTRQRGEKMFSVVHFDGTVVTPTVLSASENPVERAWPFVDGDTIRVVVANADSTRVAEWDLRTTSISLTKEIAGWPVDLRTNATGQLEIVHQSQVMRREPEERADCRAHREVGSRWACIAEPQWTWVEFFGEWMLRTRMIGSAQVLPPGGEKWINLQKPSFCSDVRVLNASEDPLRLVTSCEKGESYVHAIWSPEQQRTWKSSEGGAGSIGGRLTYPVYINEMSSEELKWTLYEGILSEKDTKNLKFGLQRCKIKAEESAPDLTGTVTILAQNGEIRVEPKTKPVVDGFKACLEKWIEAIVGSTNQPRVSINIALRPDKLHPGGGLLMRRHMSWVDAEEMVMWETEPLRPIHAGEASVPRQMLAAAVNPAANLRDGPYVWVDFPNDTLRSVEGLPTDCPGYLRSNAEKDGRVILTCKEQAKPGYYKFTNHWSIVVDVHEGRWWKLNETPLVFLDRDRVLVTNQTTSAVEILTGFTAWSIATLQ